MEQALAKKIAALINEQNGLDAVYTTSKVLENAEQYICMFGEDARLIGVVEVKKVQWYQCEVRHLSVGRNDRGRGVGSSLVTKAETRARDLGARIVQCTIRENNTDSVRLFERLSYERAVCFNNHRTGNRVFVYQKILNQ